MRGRKGVVVAVAALVLAGILAGSLVWRRAAEERRLRQFRAERGAFWARMVEVRDRAAPPDLRLPFDPGEDAFQLITNLQGSMDLLSGLAKLAGKGGGSSWEAIQIGFPNRIRVARVRLDQLRIRLLEQMLAARLARPGATALRRQLTEADRALEAELKRGGLAD
ncbi:MAG: hypothetical protein ACM3RP_03090 [Chitinophagales bacterium]